MVVLALHRVVHPLKPPPVPVVVGVVGRCVPRRGGDQGYTRGPSPSAARPLAARTRGILHRMLRRCVVTCALTQPIGQPWHVLSPRLVLLCTRNMTTMAPVGVGTDVVAKDKREKLTRCVPLCWASSAAVSCANASCVLCMVCGRVRWTWWHAR